MGWDRHLKDPIPSQEISEGSSSSCRRQKRKMMVHQYIAIDSTYIL